MADEQTDTRETQDRNAGRIVHRIDEWLGLAGSALIRRPAVVVLLVSILPAIYIIGSVLGGPSWLLYLFHERNVKPDYQPLVAVTELIFDASIAAFLPLATLLITSVLMIYGLLKERRTRDASWESQQEQLETRLASSLEELVEDARSQVRHMTEESARKMHEHLEVLFPGWTISVSDPLIRENMRTLTTTVRNEIHRTTDEHRVVIRSVFRGMSRRFSTLTANLAHKGSFMDPTERRELTQDLYVSTKSYHVIFNGFKPLKSGDWRWHDDYLEFLRCARDAHGEHVTWTFADWDTATGGSRKAAIREIQALGIPCFVFGKAGTSGDVGREMVEAFLKKGPLIEVFGRDFPTAERQNIKPDANLTWKSTSLRVRTSGALDIEWTPGGTVSPPEGEGVWAADNIDKLVRADVIVGAHTNEFRVLEKICQHRRLQTPT